MPSLDSIVDLDLDGTNYKLCLNFPALVQAEERFAAGGRTVNMLRYMDMRTVGAKQLAALFYAALITNQPDVTPEAAQSLISTINFGAIFSAVVDAWLKSQRPEGKAPEEESPDSDNGKNHRNNRARRAPKQA